MPKCAQMFELNERLNEEKIALDIVKYEESWL